MEGKSLGYIVGNCRLQFLLDQAEISQQELSSRLGVTRQQVNNYVRNERTMSYKLAYNIAAILGCSMEELYYMEQSTHE